MYYKMKLTTIKRVWTEIEEVNTEFLNFRTVIPPDPVDEDATRFDFMMLRNDGAMAHLTLVGTFYIPDVSNDRVRVQISFR
jgi:hypothetical protein